MLNVHRADRDTMTLGVFDQGGGAVKTHRLRIQQRTQKRRRVMLLQPRGGVAD